LLQSLEVTGGLLVVTIEYDLSRLALNIEQHAFYPSLRAEDEVLKIPINGFFLLRCH
jgi:hypothetical protein